MSSRGIIAAALIISVALAIIPSRVLPEPAWAPDEFVELRLDETAVLPAGRSYRIDVEEERQRALANALMVSGTLRLSAQTDGTTDPSWFVELNNGSAGPPWSIGLDADSVVRFVVCDETDQCGGLAEAAAAGANEIRFSFQRQADERSTEIGLFRLVALVSALLAAGLLGASRLRRH